MPGSWRPCRQVANGRFWGFREQKYLILNSKSFEMLSYNPFPESFGKIFCPHSLVVGIWGVMGWGAYWEMIWYTKEITENPCRIEE